MADHVMESRVWLARPRPDVFAFLADPSNLARVMPPALRVRLLTPGVRMAAGAVLEFRIAWLGVPLRWRMFVREWDPPYRFVDVQVNGPYARWEHRHRLLEDGGGTWIEDRVTYRLPGGHAVLDPGAAPILQQPVPMLPARIRPVDLHVHEAIGRVPLAHEHPPAQRHAEPGDAELEHGARGH